MIYVLLSLYSVVISIYLIWRQKQVHKPSELDGIWNKITVKDTYDADDLKAIAEIAKVRQSEAPWYERSVSTIGIVAFFSMLIATSVQTVGSAKTEIESSNLRWEIKELELQRNSWRKLVKELSELIIYKKGSDTKLEKSEGDVLQQRLIQIEEIDKNSLEEESEKLKIYLALKQFDKAAALIDKLPLEGTTSETKLFLAEMCFIDGAKERAKPLLEKFEHELSKQPVEWQVRYFSINVALGSNPEEYRNEVSALKQITQEEAVSLLRDKANELKMQADIRRKHLMENR
jgi:hypothetical protein